MTADAQVDQNSALLRAILELSEFHRERERRDSAAPQGVSVTLLRHARSLQALMGGSPVTEPRAVAARR